MKRFIFRETKEERVERGLRELRRKWEGMYSETDQAKLLACAREYFESDNDPAVLDKIPNVQVLDSWMPASG